LGTEGVAEIIEQSFFKKGDLIPEGINHLGNKCNRLEYLFWAQNEISGESFAGLPNEPEGLSNGDLDFSGRAFGLLKLKPGRIRINPGHKTRSDEPCHVPLVSRRVYHFQALTVHAGRARRQMTTAALLQPGDLMLLRLALLNMFAGTELGVPGAGLLTCFTTRSCMCYNWISMCLLHGQTCLTNST
jgi:hypothetical protein